VQETDIHRKKGLDRVDRQAEILLFVRHT